MSALLGNAQQATNAEKETDRIGGFQLLDSGVHPLEIELAYLDIAQSGARALVIHAKSDAGSLRTTQYFTSGEAKGFKTYYEKDGKQFNLPGFTLVNDIFVMAGLNGIDDAVVEQRVIKKWNKDLGAEANTSVQMVTNLLGKTVAFGVLKQIVDKTTKGADGEYHATGETREENEVVKIFHPQTAHTAAELELQKNSAEPVEASFIHQWKDKYDGEVINKAKGAANGAPAAAQGQAAPTAKKLFS